MELLGVKVLSTVGLHGTVVLLTIEVQRWEAQATGAESRRPYADLPLRALEGRQRAADAGLGTFLRGRSHPRWAVLPSTPLLARPFSRGLLE